MPANAQTGVTIAIPTYGREAVLVETLASLLSLDDGAEEVLVLDQTAQHEPETEAALAGWAADRRIRWIRLQEPSIPKAMNAGLRAAESAIVLFLDDDIVPQPELVAAHRRAHAELGVVAVTGMVLQPGEEPAERPLGSGRGERLRRDLEFSFRSKEKADVWNVMAGNLSVQKGPALACGGFDERFVGVAYRFETEFCRRLRRLGGRVIYEPAAVIRHLKAPSGGTRTWGCHQTSARPEHSVGDYYFAFLEGRGAEVVTYPVRRFLQETLSRFHRKHPWYIPAKALGEVRGFLLAARLRMRKGQAG